MSDRELLALVAAARFRGLYPDDPDWDAIDDALEERGLQAKWGNQVWKTTWHAS